MSLLIPDISTDYQLFAEGEFCDLYGREYRVKIEQKSFDALLVPNVLNFAGNPIVVTQHGAGSVTESPIKAQDLSLNLNSIEDFQYLKLYAGNNFDYRLRLIYGGSTIWLGYVIPDQWNEAFISPPYQNNLSFIDGLSMLKNFNVEDDTGCYLVGRFTWLNFILWMLSKVDKGCMLIDAINILEERADETSLTAGFLADTIIDVEAFRGMTCYEALEKLLYPNYQITYASNRYTIRRIDQPQDYQGISYDYKGNYIATAVINPLTSVTCATSPQTSRVVWVEGSQQLEIIPAVKRVKFTQKYGLKESIIPRSGFDSCDFQQNGVPKSPWLSMNITKKEFDDRTCAEMKPGPAAYLEAQARPEYVEEKETFVLEVGQRWGTLGTPRQEFGTNIYYGARGRTELHERETQVNPNFIYLGQQAPYSWFYQAPQFEMKNGDYIVFPGNRPAIQNDGYPSLPVGFEAGIYYKIINLVYVANPPRYRFDLSEANNPTQRVEPSLEDRTKYFIFKYNPMYIRTELQTDGGMKSMSQRGEFLAGMHTPMELPVNQKRDGQYFELGFESDPESDNQAGDGFIYLLIEKPKPIYQSGETDTRIHGTYFIDYVRLYFKDQPEERRFTLQLSNKHNLIKDVELWFAEIYKGVDRAIIDPNGILKFFNTLIYRDGSFDGKVSGKWNIRRGDDVELKDYSTIIREFFANLYLKPRYLLRGNLDSRIYLFGKTLTESATGKAYMINSAVWDVYMAHWDVELHEIGLADATRAKAYSDGYDEGYD